MQTESDGWRNYDYKGAYPYIQRFYKNWLILGLNESKVTLFKNGKFVNNFDSIEAIESYVKSKEK